MVISPFNFVSYKPLTVSSLFWTTLSYAVWPNRKIKYRAKKRINDSDHRFENVNNNFSWVLWLTGSVYDFLFIYLTFVS